MPDAARLAPRGAYDVGSQPDHDDDDADRLQEAPEHQARSQCEQRADREQKARGEEQPRLDLTRARATGVRDQEPFDDAGGDEHEVTRDLRERVRADQRSVLFLEIVRREKDLDDDSQRGADQERRKPEDD